MFLLFSSTPIEYPIVYSDHLGDITVTFESHNISKKIRDHFSSVLQFSLVTQWCPTLCNPMNRCTPGLPVHQQLPEFTQTHVH